MLLSLLRRFPVLLLAWSFWSAWLTVALSARANGRYPLANELVLDPRDPTHLVARTTFGLLDSRDTGASWQWICEQAIDPNGLQDPAIAVTSGGRTLVSVSHGVAIAQNGCSWHVSSGLSDAQYMIDFAVDPSKAGRVVGLVDEFADGGQAFAIFESLDEGESWSALLPVQGDDIAPTTIEVAPSGRLYLAGMHPSTGAGLFVRVDDGGSQTMTGFDLSGGSNAFVAAVDHENADRAYVRTTAGASGEPGRLLVTSDGGATFQEVLSLPGGLSGFALSPDGSKVAAGSTNAGVSIADTQKFSFQKKSAVGPLCLTWTERGLYLCASEAQDQVTIGLSSDDGSTFAPLLHLDQIAPLACDLDAQESAACAGRWSGTANALGVDGGSGPASTTGVSDDQEQAAHHSGCGCELGPSGDAHHQCGPIFACFGVLIGVIRSVRKRGARNVSRRAARARSAHRPCR